MIVLDTNVISELMRAVPDPRVLAWLVRQPMAGLFTTTLTQAEIFYGLRLLPEGRRRDDLIAAARPIFEIEMAGRILSFDGDAALVYPNIAAHRRRLASPLLRSTPKSRRSRVRGARIWPLVTFGISSNAGSS